MKYIISFCICIPILFYLSFKIAVDFNFYFNKSVAIGRVIETKKIDDGLINTYWLETKYYNCDKKDSIRVKLKYVKKEGGFPKTIKIGYIYFISSHEFLLSNEPKINHLILDIIGLLFFTLITTVFGLLIWKKFKLNITN